MKIENRLFCLGRRFLSPGLIALVLALGACGSEEEESLSEAEKERRQELTFDISGSYLTGSASERPATLEITNEAKFHNIRAVFALGRQLNPSEASEIDLAIKKNDQRMQQTEVDQIIHKLGMALQKVALGEGSDSTRRGGDNVVLDAKGEESEAVIASREQVFHEVLFPNAVEKYSFRVDFYFTAEAATRSIDYRTTRNTDRDGASASGEKGMFLTIFKELKDSGGHSQERATVTDLKLGISSFEPQ